MTLDAVIEDERLRPYREKRNLTGTTPVPDEAPLEIVVPVRTSLHPWPRTSLTLDEATAAFASPDFNTGVGAGAQSRTHRLRLKEALDVLLQFEGATWQERWEQSKLEDALEPFERLAALKRRDSPRLAEHQIAAAGLAYVFALDLVRPSYEFLFTHIGSLNQTAQVIFSLRDPDGLAELDAAIHRRSKNPDKVRKWAYPQLGRILVHTGHQRLRDVTFDDVEEAYNVGARILQAPPPGATYDALTWAQFLPDNGKSWANRHRVGPLEIAQLVDRTGIKPGKIRDLLVLYIRQRASGLNYSTTNGLVTTLVKNFWCVVQEIDPTIDDLRLDVEVVTEWKERARYIQAPDRRAGQLRASVAGIYTAVRAFYWDIADWAHEAPERFAQFAAKNIITSDDMRPHAKTMKQQQARSHARTRERLPHLQTLAESVETQRGWYAEALRLVSTAGVDEEFSVLGVPCVRVVGRRGAAVVGRQAYSTGKGLLVQRHDTGEVFDASHWEDITFWQWAIVGILKETGLRVEELEELTHTSLSQFKMPTTGELLPLLQIAPSKTDKERVMLISPDLADVLSDVLDRVRDEDGRVPLLNRWDYHERVTIPPLPLLMQRDYLGERQPIKRGWIKKQIEIATDLAGIVDLTGKPIRFQPHDFRRMYLTDIVQSGLPVHIAAKIAGHDSLDTTQGYTAVYDEDVFTQHRLYIERRRAERPREEYRLPTDAEWDAFIQDFGERELELGSCGRAFGTSCEHEHACLRCPMLRVNPARKKRLLRKKKSIEADLATAKRHGWKGEIGLLQVTLIGAEDKLRQMDAAENRTSTVSLGLPQLRVLTAG